MQIIFNRITKITNRVDKVSKRNFTKLMGCNNNKIATLEFFFFFFDFSNTIQIFLNPPFCSYIKEIINFHYQHVLY